MKRHFVIFIFCFLGSVFSLDSSIGQQVVIAEGFDDINKAVSTQNGKEYTILNNWNFNNQDGDNFKIASVNPSLLVVKPEIKPFNGDGYLKMNFKVSSNGVRDNYITTKLSSTLKPNYKYQIKYRIHKSTFSPANIKDLQVCFTTQPISDSVYFKSHGWKIGVVSTSLVGLFYNNGWLEITLEYTAKGVEQFISIGAIGQRFSTKDLMNTGNLMVDKLPSQMNFNSTYFLDEFSVTELGYNENALEQVLKDNHHERVLGSTNLIVNGGFETFENKKIYYSNNSVALQFLAPYWHSLNENMSVVIRNDSNDRQSELKQNFTYMGNGALRMKILKSNERHIYEQNWSIDKNKDGPDVIRHYENKPSSREYPVYEKGSYVVNILKDTLHKGSVYQFEMMASLTNGSSYGCTHIGVYLLDSLPKDKVGNIWMQNPTELLDIRKLALSENFQHLKVNLKSRGGERFLVFGYLDLGTDVILTNSHFNPVKKDECGPRTVCFDKHIYYKDSLFAEYIFDNVLLRELGDSLEIDARIYGDNRNQVQIFFGAIPKGNVTVKANFINAKKALYEMTEVLRINDGICAVDLTKNKDVYLLPVILDNKKRVLRKLRKPRLTKKTEKYSINTTNLLFSGKENIGFNNHVVILTDGSIEWDSVEGQLVLFAKNGGFISVLYVGEPDSFSEVQERYRIFPNIKFIDCNSFDCILGFVDYFIGK